MNQITSVRTRRTAGLVAGLLATLAAPSLDAQTMTLREALTRADASGFQNRIATGRAEAQRAEAGQALRGILPAVRVEAGYLRSNDPIGAFGTTLRQRLITQQDFDPARLNRPDAVTNFSGGLVVEQPLINVDAWLGRRAGTNAAEAMQSAAQWDRIATRVQVIRAYYGVTLAQEKVVTLRAAEQAALAHRKQAEAMAKQGLVTTSDVLLASVRAGEISAQLAEAAAEASTARRQFRLVLGVASDTGMLPPAALPSTANILALVARDTAAQSTESRADVIAATRALDAATANQRRTRALLLPRVQAFARYDYNSPTALFRGERAWTAGLAGSWSPFSGASELTEQRIAAARERTARASAEAASANAGLEEEQSMNTLQAAVTRLEIAERSVSQSAEAHRILAKKYQGGIATVTELLSAAAVETQSALGLAVARYAVITAAAERRKALGLDPAALASLDDAAASVVPNTR